MSVKLFKVGDEVEVTREDSVRHFAVMNLSTRGKITKLVPDHFIAHKHRPYFVSFVDLPGEWSFAGWELKKLNNSEGI